MSTRIWREWQHPRDERGRFARKGTHSRKWMERAFESFKRDRPEATPETFRLHLTPRDTAVTRAAAAAIAGKRAPQSLQQISAAIGVPRGEAAAKRVDEAAAKLRAIKGSGIDADIARRAAPKLDAVAEDLRAGRINNTEASNRIGAARASIADPDAAGVLRRLDGELAPRPVARPRPAEPAPAAPPPPATPAPAAPADAASLVRGLGTLNNAPPSARDRYARQAASLQAITFGAAASTATDAQRASLARALLDEQVRHGGTGGDEAAALRSLIERWKGPRATEPPPRPRVVVEPPRRQEWGRAPQFNVPTAPRPAASDADPAAVVASLGGPPEGMTDYARRARYESAVLSLKDATAPGNRYRDKDRAALAALLLKDQVEYGEVGSPDRKALQSLAGRWAGSGAAPRKPAAGRRASGIRSQDFTPAPAPKPAGEPDGARLARERGVIPDEVMLSTDIVRSRGGGWVARQHGPDGKIAGGKDYPTKRAAEDGIIADRQARAFAAGETGSPGVTPVDTSRDVREAGGMPPVSTPESQAVPTSPQEKLVDAIDNGGARLTYWMTRKRTGYQLNHPDGRVENVPQKTIDAARKSGALVDSVAGPKTVKQVEAEKAAGAARAAERTAARNAERLAAVGRTMTPDEERLAVDRTLENLSRSQVADGSIIDMRRVTRDEVQALRLHDQGRYDTPYEMSVRVHGYRGNAKTIMPYGRIVAPDGSVVENPEFVAANAAREKTRIEKGWEKQAQATADAEAYVAKVRAKYTGKSRASLLKAAKAAGVDTPRGVSDSDLAEALTRHDVTTNNTAALPLGMGVSNPLLVGELTSEVQGKLRDAANQKGDRPYAVALGRVVSEYKPGMEAIKTGTVHPFALSAALKIARREGLDVRNKDGQRRVAELLGVPDVPADAETETLHADELSLGDLVDLGGLANRVASVIRHDDGTVTIHTYGITGEMKTIPGNTEVHARLAPRKRMGALSQQSRRAVRELEELHQERIRNAYARMDTAPPIHQAPADGRRPVADVFDWDRSPHHSEWKGSRTPDAPPGHRNMVLSDPGWYDGIAARAEIYNPAGPGQPYRARIWDYEDGRTLAEFQSNDLKEAFAWADQVHDTRRGKAMPRRPGVTAEYTVKEVKATSGGVTARGTVFEVRERLSTGEERRVSGHLQGRTANEEAAKLNKAERARLGIPEPEPPKPPAPAPVKPRTNQAPTKVAPAPSKPVGAKAQRGDLVAVLTTRTNAWQGAKSTTEDVVRVYRVASVNRDGKVTKVLPVDAGPDAKPVDIDRYGVPTLTRIIPQSKVDIDSAVDAVRAHHWEGHPDQLKDFGSLQELVAWMKPRVRPVEQRPATAGPVRTGTPRAEALGSVTVTPDRLKSIAATWTEPRLKEAGYVQGLSTVRPGDDAVIYSRGDLRQGIVTRVTPRRVEVTYTTASAIRDQERFGGDLSVTAKLDSRDRVWIRDGGAVAQAVAPVAPSASRADTPGKPLTREQLVTRGEMMRQADRTPHIEALRQEARSAGGDRTKEEITAEAARAGDTARAEVADLPYVGGDQFATAYGDAAREAAAQRLRRADNAATRRVLESAADDPKADPARRATAAWVLNRFDRSGREEKMAADDARRREADFRSDANTLAEMSATAQSARKHGIGAPEADAAVAEFDAKLAGLVDRNGMPVDLVRQGFGVDEARRLVRAAALRRAEVFVTRQAHRDVVDRRQAMKTPEGRRAADDAVKFSAMHLENVELRVPVAERAAEDANRAIDAEVAKLRTQRAEVLARPVTISPQARAEMTISAFNEATRGEGVPSPHSQEAQAEIRRARKAAGLPSQAAIKKMSLGERKFAERATAMVDRTVRNRYGAAQLGVKVEAGQEFLRTADIEDPKLRAGLTRQVDDWAAANDQTDAIIKRGERDRDVALAALQAIGDGPTGQRGNAPPDMLRGLDSRGEDSEGELVHSMAMQVGIDAAGRFADRIRAMGPVPESDLAQTEHIMPGVRRELDRSRKSDTEINAEVVSRRGGYRLPTDAEISGMTGAQKMLATEAAAAVTTMVHKVAEHEAAGRESGVYESAARNPLASRAARDRFEALYQRAHERAMQLQDERFNAEYAASVKANAYHAVAAGDVGEPGAATDIMLRDLGPRARAAVEQLARTVGAAAAMRLANDLRASGSWTKAY